jgi:hypothetical protein
VLLEGMSLVTPPKSGWAMGVAVGGTTEMKDARTFGVGRLGCSSSSVVVLSPGERPRGSGEEAAPWFSNIARKLRTPDDMAAEGKRWSVTESVTWRMVDWYGRAWKWNTCEMRWWVLGMKPPICLCTSNAMMSRGATQARQGQGGCNLQRTRSDCFTTNSALGN